MSALQRGSSRQRAFAVTFTCIAAVTSSRAPAQAPHPFAPPVPIPAFSLSAVAALVDANRDGSLDVLLPGPFFGTLLTTLDENGGCLHSNGQGPAPTAGPGMPSVPIAIAMAGGRLDADEREDLVTVTSVGTVHFHHNLGSLRIDRAAFAPDAVIDSFLSAFPISPPFINYSFPRAQVVDLDHDGNSDVLVGGGPVDRWSAATCPGFVGYYRGNGLGGFQVGRVGVPGSVIDLDVVDLDGNGVDDHVIALIETGSLGAFSYDLHHFTVVNGALVASGLPQNLGPGRFTALAVADVAGDSNPDYLLANTALIAGSTTATVYWFQGNGQGAISLGTWGTFLLPPNLTPLGDFVTSLQVGDWNRDGHRDLAILRGFVQAPAALSGAGPSYADAELLVASGPALANAALVPIALPGYLRFSSTDDPNFALLPLTGAPDLLRTFDAGRDGSADLLVTGLRPTGNPTITLIATLRNTTPPSLGDARFEKVGSPSGGVAAFPARIGFDGGRPSPGNASFACTLQNVRGGCLVGLLWSPLGQANIMSAYGFDLHLVPTVFGCGVLAAGTQAGEGFSSFPLPIPPVPSLVGDAGYFQYDYYDHVAGVFGGTQATGLWIGN
ncbi:MAG: VCBS repeat-containing protein [Planctomycetota bacterium]